LELQAPDPELMGLIQGLSDLSPKLQQYAYASRFSQQKEDARHMQTGAGDAARGQEMKPGSPEAYQRGYMQQRGQMLGDEAGQAFLTHLSTNFNWDTGDYRQEAKKFFADDTKGMDEDTLEGYNATSIKHIEAGHAQVLKYRGEAIVAQTESDFMARMSGAMQAYTDNGMPVPVELMDAFRNEGKSVFGITPARFNDLRFTAVKSLADQGNPDLYNLLKQKPPGGAPAMYDMPEWKPKIDAGIIHATNESLRRSRAEQQVNKDAREETQGKAVMPLLLLADTDKESALTQLTSLAKSGVISDPKDYHAFVNMIHSVGNKAERADAQMAETELLAGIYQGKVNQKTITADTRISPAQQRTLISSFQQYQSTRRQEAAQGQQAEYAVLKSPRYKEAEEYVEANLKAVSNMFDFDKSGVEYSSGQLALAKRELFNAALVAKSPEEMEAKSFSIVTEYQDRARKYADIKNKADAKRIRFSTPEALGVAFASGKVSREEAELHMNFFESQLRKVATNAAR
jgi:hypothetical protein